MNISKQILEAVNRGIRLALDDYQDIENNNSISHYDDIIGVEDVIYSKYRYNTLLGKFNKFIV